MKKNLFYVILALIAVFIVYVNVVIIAFGGGITLEAVGMLLFTVLYFVTLGFFLIKKKKNYLMYWGFLALLILIASLFFEDSTWFFSVGLMLPVVYVIYCTFDKTI